MAVNGPRTTSDEPRVVFNGQRVTIHEQRGGDGEQLATSAAARHIGQPLADMEGYVIPTRVELLRKATDIPAPPVVIEAYWDGDTTGWVVVLTMLYLDGSTPNRQYREFDPGVMRGEDGDLRVFNGQVPPWPEAVRAKEIGEELAAVCF